MYDKLPPSREVRLQDGVLEGNAELIAFNIYSGDAGTLASSMIQLELVMERDRSRSVHAFAHLLRRKLMQDGYVVVSDLDHALQDFHANEVLGTHPVIPEPEEEDC